MYNVWGDSPAAGMEFGCTEGNPYKMANSTIRVILISPQKSILHSNLEDILNIISQYNNKHAH